MTAPPIGPQTMVCLWCLAQHPCQDYTEALEWYARHKLDSPQCGDRGHAGPPHHRRSEHLPLSP